MSLYDKFTIRWLEEAITFSSKIGDKYVDYKTPLKDTDVVRVYHGFYDSDNAIEFCKYGVSGKELASRVYSYESNNNPYGLFVTSNFKTAKYFSRGGAGGPAVIIEFQTKVSNLEAPVWPSGGYTVQGQMSQYWSGEDLKSQMADRERGRLAAREKIKQSTRKDIEFAKQSDKPELALSLFYSGEFQALFVGDLNSNMIRAVWVYEGDKTPEYETFTRMSCKDFLKKYDIEKPKTDYNRYKSDKSSKYYKPNDDWKGLDDFLKRIQKHYKENDEWMDIIRKQVVDDLKTDSKDLIYHQLQLNLWPKQLKQACEDLGIKLTKDYIP